MIDLEENSNNDSFRTERSIYIKKLRNLYNFYRHAQSVKNKLRYLCSNLCQLIVSSGIIALTETWLIPHTLFSEWGLIHYNICWSDRISDIAEKGEGVLLDVKKGMKVSAFDKSLQS